jgi:hypothetical protein
LWDFLKFLIIFEYFPQILIFFGFFAMNFPFFGGSQQKNMRDFDYSDKEEKDSHKGVKTRIFLDADCADDTDSPPHQFGRHLHLFKIVGKKQCPTSLNKLAL